ILSQFTWYWIFFIPAGAIALMGLVDYLVVRDRPSQAGLKDFDTGDATTAPLDASLAEPPVQFSYIVRKVFSNPIILTIAVAEFCTGFVRQGLLLYFTEYLEEVQHVTKKLPLLFDGTWFGSPLY